LQSTINETMPEPTQQNAPVIRTPTGGAPQPSSQMHTAVQLTFSFEIASMQLTPTFKMGSLQLRPTSKIVTMRLAPSQYPQPARIDIANPQLGPKHDIGMIQLNLAGAR